MMWLPNVTWSLVYVHVVGFCHLTYLNVSLRRQHHHVLGQDRVFGLCAKSTVWINGDSNKNSFKKYAASTYANLALNRTTEHATATHPPSSDLFSYTVIPTPTPVYHLLSHGWPPVYINRLSLNSGWDRMINSRRGKHSH